ncbi:MAG: MarR family transcriptional regulator [Candidatus Aenigmatarchaeota archaeon]
MIMGNNGNMKKTVMVCLELMKIEGKTTQSEISQKLSVSLSTVNRTVKKLEGMGAVDVRQRSLGVLDKEKILMYLASLRNPSKDMVYETRVEGGVKEIEKNMPGGTDFTAYSAYKFSYGDMPADYSEVYVYAEEDAVDEIKERFPRKDGPANLFVLRKEVDVTPSLIFADLWNLREWYSKEFVGDLRDRILE